MDYGIFAYLCGCNFMDVLLSVLLRKLTVSKNFFIEDVNTQKGYPKKTQILGHHSTVITFFYFFLFFDALDMLFL